MTTEALCPGCLASQPGEGFCARCGVPLRPDGVTCTAVLGEPSRERVSLAGERGGERFVVRLQRLKGDNPEARRKREKQLARAGEIPGVVPWRIVGTAQREGATHWVLLRPWVPGEGLDARCARAHPGNEAVFAALSRWLRAMGALLDAGAAGVHLSHRAGNLIVTDDGVAVVDLWLEGPARWFDAQREALGAMIASVVDATAAPRFARFQQKLDGGGYDAPQGVESALRHALGVSSPRPSAPAARDDGGEAPETEPMVSEEPREQRKKVAAPQRVVSRQRSAGERIIEMTWRCSSCRHTNLGRHKVCVSCGGPKDGTERWEMPADTAAAVSVTRDDLLRMALDGPDWRCAYCGSDQRRADRACERCGASAVEGSDVPDDAAGDRARDVFAGGSYDHEHVAPVRWPGWVWVRRVAAVLLALLVLGLGIRAWMRRPRDLDARVTARAWRHVVRVERWAVQTREGFAEQRAGEVFDVTSLGEREHHRERVLDGYDTEHYTERVLDGYDTEHYTASVACGQDCTERSPSCSERCTSNRNGFATCRNVCTGGGRSCTTRYCSESRTRQVARYRNEPRTRQVPRYRMEPRYAEFFRWRVWDWATHRTLVRAGSAEAPRWPTDDELALDRAVGPGERERATREATYRVSVTDEDGSVWTFTPTREDEAAGFAPGSAHRVHREAARVTVDGRRWAGLP